MLRKPSPLFNRLRDYIDPIPVVDCHEHLRGPDRDLKDAPVEPIQALIVMYLVNDFYAAGASRREIELLQDPAAGTGEKWPIFSRLWASTQHTAYAQVTKRVLKQVYGVDKLTFAALTDIADRLAARDAAHYTRVLDDAGIRAVIADVLFPPPWEEPIRYFGSPVLKDFLAGKFSMPAAWHPVFSLPYYHEIRLRPFVDYMGELANRSVTSLEDYEQVMFELIKRSKDLGVVALKDQSAYHRVINYELPPRDDAERIFNRLLNDPRSQLAWPEAKPLDDYLFHQFMRFARLLGLPVQLHTGHLIDTGNRVAQANAAHLTSVLELHSEVRFDLFHGNWPYMGDLLFLGKNYRNVTLNLCWVPMIDPLYTQELLKRAVMTVPHVKILGFGGDFFIAPEFSAAHLTLARDVMAGALADLVECGWLEEEEATGMAADWLYNNPNRFYALGLKPYEVDTGTDHAKEI